MNDEGGADSLTSMGVKQVTPIATDSHKPSIGCRARGT